MSWTKTTTIPSEWSKPSTTSASLSSIDKLDLSWTRQREDSSPFDSTDKTSLSWTDVVIPSLSWTNGSPSLFTAKAINGYFDQWDAYFNLSEDYFGYTSFNEIAPGLSDFSEVVKSSTDGWDKP